MSLLPWGQGPDRSGRVILLILENEEAAYDVGTQLLAVKHPGQERLPKLDAFASSEGFAPSVNICGQKQLEFVMLLFIKGKKYPGKAFLKSEIITECLL